MAVNRPVENTCWQHFYSGIETENTSLSEFRAEKTDQIEKCAIADSEQLEERLQHDAHVARPGWARQLDSPTD
jgi:hypothetical protein